MHRTRCASCSAQQQLDLCARRVPGKLFNAVIGFSHIISVCLQQCVVQSGDTALHSAASRRDEAIIKLLLNRANTNVNAVNSVRADIIEGTRLTHMHSRSYLYLAPIASIRPRCHRRA